MGRPVSGAGGFEPALPELANKASLLTGLGFGARSQRPSLEAVIPALKVGATTNAHKLCVGLGVGLALTVDPAVAPAATGTLGAVLVFSVSVAHTGAL